MPGCLVTSLGMLRQGAVPQGVKVPDRGGLGLDLLVCISKRAPHCAL